MTRCLTEILRPLFLGLILAVAAALPSPAAGPAPQPLDPKRLDAGAALYRQGRYQDAMDRFLTLLEQDPADAEAREFEQRSVDALIHERIMAARLEAGQMLYEALNRREKSTVAARLVRQAEEHMSEERPIEAEDLILKALDIEPDSPDAHAALDRNQVLLRREAAKLKSTGSPSEHYSRRYTIQGLIKFNDLDRKGSIPLLQQALFLVTPTEYEFSLLLGFLARAQAETSRPAPAPAATATPQPAAAVRAGPPTPAVLPKPPHDDGEARVPAPAPKPVHRPRRRAVAGPPSPEVKPAAPVGVDVPLAVPVMTSDPAKSDDLYLKGVTAYIAGHIDEARRDLEDSLAADANNLRAKKLLERIDREARKKQ